MIKIGKMNRLRVARLLDFGLALDGGEQGEIFLANKYMPDNAKADDELDVFVFIDGDGELVAIDKPAKASVDSVAYLKVVNNNELGAFLDWGMPKDLLVHVSQQKVAMRVGESYLVYIYYDEQYNRISASAKIDRYLDLTEADYEPNQAVDLIIADKTDIGYKAIINHRHWGVIHFNEVFRKLEFGMSIKGYVSRVREDGKIDLTLQAAGYQKIDGIARKILTRLKSCNGFIDINDKSSPERIYHVFGVSKKAFKQSIGSLYKQRLIEIKPNGIYLNDDNALD